MKTRREFLAAAVGGAADPWKRGFDAARPSDPALLGWQGVNHDLVSDDLAVEGRWPENLAGTF